LDGFYDVCIGEEKQLFIRYLFHDRIHEVLVEDEEPVGLPLKSHLV
jgi:DnaJ family protein C protein 11